MAYTITLTGQKRLRAKKRFFGPALLVLQVEWKESGSHHDDVGGCRPYERTFWSDARVEDVTECGVV